MCHRGQWSRCRRVVPKGALLRHVRCALDGPQMRLWEEAKIRAIGLIAVPTAEACRLLASTDSQDVYAILHVDG